METIASSMQMCCWVDAIENVIVNRLKTNNKLRFSCCLMIKQLVCADGKWMNNMGSIELDPDFDGDWVVEFKSKGSTRLIN